MTAFSPEPILRRKQHALDVQDLEGLLHLRIQFRDFKLFSGFYTRIDQVFILWGMITAIVFFTAQFVSINWTQQAVAWSILTAIGAWGTCHLAWYWVSVERLRWVVYTWVALMLGGLLLTNWGIFGGGWVLLPHLCRLWLGLSAIGYGITAWGLRSRALLASGLLHLGAIALLAYFPTWQFLFTGVITAGSLFLLAEVQWDMQSTTDNQLLTVAQKQFNLRQSELRQMEV
jgi:multidrug transporter EmrE-like cation transporter